MPDRIADGIRTADEPVRGPLTRWVAKDPAVNVGLADLRAPAPPPARVRRPAGDDRSDRRRVAGLGQTKHDCKRDRGEHGHEHREG